MPGPYCSKEQAIVTVGSFQLTTTNKFVEGNPHISSVVGRIKVHPQVELGLRDIRSVLRGLSHWLIAWLHRDPFAHHIYHGRTNQNRDWSLRPMTDARNEPLMSTRLPLGRTLVTRYGYTPV